jgi:hypothetical protein
MTNEGGDLLQGEVLYFESRSQKFASGNENCVVVLTKILYRPDFCALLTIRGF